MKRRASPIVANAIVWALLLLVPFWLPLVGGYTALGSRILIYALCAMALNVLLGFTGMMSFGQAAYFGLGGYGAGLTLVYLTHSTWLAVLAGTALGGLAALVLGALVTPAATPMIRPPRTLPSRLPMPPTTMATKVAMITSLPIVGDSCSTPAASTPANPASAVPMAKFTARSR